MEKDLQSESIPDWTKEQKKELRKYSIEILDAIRKNNGQQFINDLRKYRVYIESKAGVLILQNKQNIWIIARDTKLPYEIIKTNSGKTVMRIL